MVLVRNVEIIRIGVPSLGVGVQIGERQGRGQSAQTMDPFFRRRLQPAAALSGSPFCLPLLSSLAFRTGLNRAS